MIDTIQRLLTMRALQLATLAMVLVAAPGCDPTEVLDPYSGDGGVRAAGCFIQNGSFSDMQNSGGLLPSSGSFQVDQAFQREALVMIQAFGVTPSGWFYQDGSPNAFASPTAVTPSGPSGTIGFGMNMMAEQFAIDSRGLTLLAIMAHEFAHITQFQRGGLPGNTKPKELHADFLAGWYLALIDQYTENDLRSRLQTFYNLGDYQFNSPNHHGTPDERLAAATAGYQSGVRSVSAAYSAGLNFISGN